MIQNILQRNKQLLQLMLGILVVMVIVANDGFAQSSEGFMYGKVHTKDNVYTGQLRWGKEEAYWTDMFNASKTSSDHKYMHKEEDSDGWNFDWRLSSIWEDKHGSTTHQFSCQFGDLAEIEIIGSHTVIVKLKNGAEMKLSGEGYNDIGGEIRVLDREIGHISVNWSSIRKIEFLPTPSKLTKHYGNPMFGTVETSRKGSFTGVIQWDHDERLGADKLDGDTSDGDVSIEFSSIKSIEKQGYGSKVILKSDRELFLTNSNDVNHENRGIIVMIDGVGHVDIPWRAFKKVTFDNTKKTGPSYDKFKAPSGLKGTVKLYDGESLNGRIIYDVDEKWEFETLEGKDDELEYTIPFRNIKRIQPKNYDYSLVELRNANQLLLGGMRDVSDHNDGLLVFLQGQDEPKHISWRKITEIVFE